MSRQRGWMQRVLVALAALAVIGAGNIACDPIGSEPAEYEQFEDGGGRNYTTFTSGGCRYAVPTSGSQNPIITWGNGTGATPTSYLGFLNHWASHGFITTASTSTSTGSGIQMRSCLADARGLSSASSTYFGASGHSQGGGGTLNAAEDESDILATALVQPDIVFTTNADARNQTADMLYLGGSSDSLAPPSTNGESIWRDSDVPTFWAVRDGASHFEPTGSGTNDYTGITTAWFVYKLMPGSPLNADAASLFQGSDCGICDWGVWETRQKFNP